MEKNYWWKDCLITDDKHQKRTQVSKTDGFVEKQKKMDFGVSSKKSTVTSKNEQRCPKSDRIVPKTNKGVQNQTVPPENGLRCIVQKKYGHIKKRTKVSKIRRYRPKTDSSVLNQAIPYKIGRLSPKSANTDCKQTQGSNTDRNRPKRNASFWNHTVTSKKEHEWPKWDGTVRERMQGLEIG